MLCSEGTACLKWDTGQTSAAGRAAGGSDSHWRGPAVSPCQASGCGAGTTPPGGSTTPRSTDSCTDTKRSAFGRTWRWSTRSCGRRREGGCCRWVRRCCCRHRCLRRWPRGETRSAVGPLPPKNYELNLATEISVFVRNIYGTGHLLSVPISRWRNSLILNCGFKAGVGSWEKINGIDFLLDEGNNCLQTLQNLYFGDVTFHPPGEGGIS